MWFLLLRYPLNILLLFRHHLILSLRTHLDFIFPKKTTVTTAKSMTMWSLSVINYSLSNLLHPSRTSAATTTESSSKSTLKFSIKGIKLFYNNYNQNLINLPVKSHLSHQVFLFHGSWFWLLQTYDIWFSVFTWKTRPIITPIIHTADNSTMHVQVIGIINTQNSLFLMSFLFWKFT